MPMSKTERIARKLSHTKQERVQISNGVPSPNDLRNDVSVKRTTPEGLVEFTKHNNTVYKKVLDRTGIDRNPAVASTSKDSVPIFQVYRSGSAHGNLVAGGERILEFNSSEIDTRNSYSTSTFLYTASERGIYSLHYNLTFGSFDVDMTYAQTYMKDSGGNRFAMHKIDEEEFAGAADGSTVNDPGMVSFSATALRHLKVGETIGVYYYQSGGSNQTDLGHLINTTNGSESIFGGYMITDVKSERAFASISDERTGGSTDEGSSLVGSGG